jgi:polyphosphate kinase
MAKTIKTRRKQNGHERYEKALRDLQIELVKLQKHVIKHDHKVLVIFEGRDASGKDRIIQRIVEHLNPKGNPRCGAWQAI